MPIPTLMASGALTGKYSASTRPAGWMRCTGTFRDKNLPTLTRVVDLLRETGGRHDKSPSQVALRWLIQHDGVVPIPGAKNAGQAVENAGACEQPLIDRPAVPCSLHRDQP
jgi:aryl-alcohol dehydrogenase-like predicted oxidoreductase